MGIGRIQLSGMGTEKYVCTHMGMGVYECVLACVCEKD